MNTTDKAFPMKCVIDLNTTKKLAVEVEAFVRVTIHDWNVDTAIVQTKLNVGGFDLETTKK